MPRRFMPSACASRPTAPSWPGPAAPAKRPLTTAPPPRCSSGSARPPPARPRPASRSWPPGPAAWAGAAAAWQRLGQPYRAAYAGFRQAEALLAGPGDRDSAAGVLGRAAAITGRLGARLLDGEVQALARRARLGLAPHAATTPPGAP